MATLQDLVIGHAAALRVLDDALRTGRMHHAWIFAGPLGVGKRTAAAQLAKVLLDRDRTLDAQGRAIIDPQGRTSRLIDAGSHPDLHVIYKELALFSENRALRERRLTNLPLDLLRERMLGGRTSDDRMHDAPAYRTPAEAAAKVFIIDEAELMDDEGQNALLKTLEEPPPATYIILVTSNPERLLPTIHSRAQIVRFHALDEPQMQRWLDASGLEVEPGQRSWLLRFAEGAPGVAELAVQYTLHRWQAQLDPMLAALCRGSYPPQLGETLGALVDEFAAAWVKAHEGASKTAANKAGARHLLRLLGLHVRDALARSCDEGTEPGRWLIAADLLVETEEQLEANVNLKQVFENLAAQLAAAEGEMLTPAWPG